MSCHTPRPLLPLAAMLTLAGACMPLTEDDDLEFRDTVGGGVINCPKCDPNSPKINDFQFPELHLGGQVNSDGVRLVGLRQPGTGIMHTLSTDALEDLVALDPITSAVVASGARLIDWELVLDKNGDTVAGLIIAHDDAVPAWTDMPRPLSAYAIAFIDDNLTKSVCPSFVDEPANPVLTIIRGAAYDRTEAIVEALDDDWVTFACADEAAYKAKMLGYEQAVDFAATGQPATVAQQNATLKMVIADYCGTGRSFTSPGMLMHWQNTAATVTAPLPDVGAIEAVWSGAGALCLGTPRYADPLDIAAECVIPTCTGFDVANTPKEWISWLPMPPNP